jgi:hypothetical protein
MSSPVLSTILAREQDALAQETRIAQCPPYVAVLDIDIVAGTPSALRAHHPVTIRALANAKAGSFIVDCPTLNSKALWVNLQKDKQDTLYRADYLTFLNSEWQAGIGNIPDSYDVDHLYNSARARIYGLQYVRMALVHYKVNRSHGAGPEKDVTKNEELRRVSDRKLMDELTSMKYWGYLPPLRSNPRDGEITAYANFVAAKLGLDPDETRNSIQVLRKKASTPWARKKV